MTVKDIIEKYLKENGYDGLAGDECGCGMDDGLAPCESCNIFECVPAYRATCDGKPSEDDEGHDCPGYEHEVFTTERPDAGEGRRKKP